MRNICPRILICPQGFSWLGMGLRGLVMHDSEYDQFTQLGLGDKYIFIKPIAADNFSLRAWLKVFWGTHKRCLCRDIPGY